MKYFMVAGLAAAALAGASSSPLLAQAQKAAQKPAAMKPQANLRTPDGHSDLQGIWTNATITPLERPKALAGKPVLTEAEALAFEKAQATELQSQDGASDGPLIAAAGSSGTGGYNVLFIDRGSHLATVDGQIRSSLIVDPSDGHVPARVRVPGLPQARLYGGAYDDVKNHPLSERCIVGFGSTSGPPMLPVLYNNNYQIVQTPDTVIILVEMVHDVRIVRIGGTHPPEDVVQWLGDSIGHWEGDTLVVDTTNFDPRNTFRGASAKQHVIERFRRENANIILYRATVEDPTFAKPLTVEFPFVAAPGPIYEYACHEGNYAMTDILGGIDKAQAGKK